MYHTLYSVAVPNFYLNLFVCYISCVITMKKDQTMFIAPYRYTYRYRRHVALFKAPAQIFVSRHIVQ